MLREGRKHAQISLEAFEIAQVQEETAQVQVETAQATGDAAVH